MSTRWTTLSAASALLAALLAGCASMAPPYERPAAPVAATFPGEPAGSAPAAVPAAEIDWQQFFVDPRLKRLIEAGAAEQPRPAHRGAEHRASARAVPDPALGAIPRP